MWYRSVVGNQSELHSAASVETLRQHMCLYRTFDHIGPTAVFQSCQIYLEQSTALCVFTSAEIRRRNTRALQPVATRTTPPGSHQTIRIPIEHSVSHPMFLRKELYLRV